MSGEPASSLPYAQPLLDAVGLFTKLHIEYALIGGVAAMYYGRARFTEDVDFIAAADHQEILASNPQAMRNAHFDPTSTWKLYHDSGVEIDIWKDEHTDDIISRAREVELTGHRVRVAEAHDLIAMKLRAGRIQDDYDIFEISRGTPLDHERIRSMVTPDQFAHFLEIQQRS